MDSGNMPTAAATVALDMFASPSSLKSLPSVLRLVVHLVTWRRCSSLVAIGAALLFNMAGTGAALASTMLAAMAECGFTAALGIQLRSPQPLHWAGPQAQRA